MTDEKRRLIQTLVEAIPTLTFGQLRWIHRILAVFGSEHEWRVADSDIFDRIVLRDFGDAMRIHHGFSAEPFSKDKFAPDYLRISADSVPLA